MNHTSSPSSQTKSLFSDPRGTENLIVGSIILVVCVCMIFAFVFHGCTSQPPSHITEAYACNSLQYRMLHYQGTSINSSVEYPLLDESEIVRKIYQGGESFGMCTIRTRQPNGEENLYTIIMSINEPVTLSANGDGSADMSDRDCEPSPPLNPNCNIFGPYNRHYIFVEILSQDENDN